MLGQHQRPEGWKEALLLSFFPSLHVTFDIVPSQGPRECHSADELTPDC